MANQSLPLGVLVDRVDAAGMLRLPASLGSKSYRTRRDRSSGSYGARDRSTYPTHTTPVAIARGSPWTSVLEAPSESSPRHG